MTDYRPIACALHSEYERLAMARTRVCVRWHDRDRSCETAGRVVDIRTRDGEEFMVLVGADDRTTAIRLDRIEAVLPLQT